MPETRAEKLIFGIFMSVSMAIGMEIYNVAISMGYAAQVGGLSSMRNAVFPAALVEASYMWIFVFIFSNLWGNRGGRALAAKIIRPGQDNPFFVTLVISGCTVLVMCPTMSMVAALLFSVAPGYAAITELPAVWVGTLIKNFPMALLWNIIAAGPLSRLLFRSIFRRGK